MGWNSYNQQLDTHTRNRDAKKKTRTNVRSIFAWASISLVALVVIFVVIYRIIDRTTIGGSDTLAIKGGKSNLIKDVACLDTPRPAVTDEIVSPPDKDKEMYLGSEVVSRTAVTNNAGFVIERIKTADGKTHRRQHYPKSPFEEPTDQYLADVVSQSPDSITPLPDMRGEIGLDEAFRNSLKTDIVINEDDAPKVKELKARVIIARENMKCTMEETGMSFIEVLTDYQKIAAENSDIRIDAIKEMREIMDKGDRDGAREYVTAMNAAFQQMGIDEIKMPKALESNKEENE